MIPEIPTWLSLAVILVTLVVTTVASLAKNRRDRADRAAATTGRDLTLRHAPSPAPHAPATTTVRPSRRPTDAGRATPPVR